MSIYETYGRVHPSSTDYPYVAAHLRRAIAAGATSVRVANVILCGYSIPSPAAITDNGWTIYNNLDFAKVAAFITSVVADNHPGFSVVVEA